MKQTREFGWSVSFCFFLKKKKKKRLAATGMRWTSAEKDSSPWMHRRWLNQQSKAWKEEEEEEEVGRKGRKGEEVVVSLGA